MVKITYDPEVAIMMIHLNNERIVESDVQDNCIIDYAENGKIVSIEVTNMDLEGALIKKDTKKKKKSD
jgi:uncharacterized protein YuzE